MTKTKVTIDRAKWRCGGQCGDFTNGKGQTKLLNHEGYMCCLGFITAAANPELNILEKGEPDDLKTIVPELTYLSSDFAFSSRRWLNTDLAVAAIAINDSERLTAREREEQLLELFKYSLYELEFVGDYEAEETNDLRTTIQHYGNKVALRLVVAGEYTSGMPVIEAIDESDEELFGRLTINVPGAALQPGEIIVKNYSENEAWVPQVLSNLSQHFVPTGRTVESGFVTMPIYKFIEAAT